MRAARIQRRYTLVEARELTGLEEARIISFIERGWISPPERAQLDEEDIARLRLIEELAQDLGVNEEAIPLVLHLLDQLCGLREELAARGRSRR
jgi:chaperone modulatory protein CbpM